MRAEQQSLVDVLKKVSDAALGRSNTRADTLVAENAELRTRIELLERGQAATMPDQPPPRDELEEPGNLRDTSSDPAATVEAGGSQQPQQGAEMPELLPAR